jgi:hypothetical protein
MKKLLFLAALLVASASAFAQGTVNIANRVTAAGIDAPIFDVDNSTRLAGTGFFVQLYAGVAGTSAEGLSAVGAAVNFRAAGAQAGYMLGGDTIRTINGIPAGGAAAVQLRAWDSAFATYEAAVAAGGKYGSSSVLNLASTGNPTSAPPGTPADLTGLQSFALVPEPSTIALAMLGGAALFLRRRK